VRANIECAHLWRFLFGELNSGRRVVSTWQDDHYRSIFQREFTLVHRKVPDLRSHRGKDLPERDQLALL
jgi:hypothetical protein